MNELKLPCDVGQVSDGSHTFQELYEHRYLLWINLLHACRDNAFKTWRMDNGDMWNDWFIAGLKTNHGMISYHLPAELWDSLNVTELERNVDYDGHTSKDVLVRLKKLAEISISVQEELETKLKRTENTLQQYAKYRNRDAMDRDVRLLGDTEIAFDEGDA